MKYTKMILVCMCLIGFASPSFAMGHRPPRPPGLLPRGGCPEVKVPDDGSTLLLAGMSFAAIVYGKSRKLK